MGQAESTPQPAAWQPDFLTAHVKQASQQLSPVKAPLKGVSSIGPDSMSISAAKNVQSFAKDGGSAHAKPYQQRPAGLDQHSYMGVAYGQLPYKQAKEVVAADRPEPIARPTVGADAFLIRKQREFAKQHEKGVRNQLALDKGVGQEALFAKKGLDKPGGHQQLDSYENQFAADARKVTLGAENKFCRSPDVGKPTNIKGDAYYVEFAKTTHSWLAPKEKSHDEWRGIKANIPVQDFVKADKDAKKANIIENSKIKALPVPQVDSMSMMMRHAKQMSGMTSSSPLKQGSPNAYDPSDSPYAMMTPAKSGGKSALPAPKVGSDSVMMSLAKKAGDMIPKVMGKESKNKPPEEVKL